MVRGSGVAGASALLATLLLLLASPLGGCQRRLTLSNTLESPEAVANAVLRALSQRDIPRLRALSLTEDEFRFLVWPELPASRPERNVPWDYAWNDLQQKSLGQLEARVEKWRGRDVEVVKVSFGGPTQNYQRFRVFRKTLVSLRDQHGAISEEELFGSTVEQAGRYKVFSYVVD